MMAFFLIRKQREYKRDCINRKIDLFMQIHVDKYWNEAYN